jgi:hypothetical protein
VQRARRNPIHRTRHPSIITITTITAQHTYQHLRDCLSAHA